MLDILHLQPGAQVDVAVESGRLVVEPRKRPRYTLHQLLEQCNPRKARTKGEREWLAGKPAGAEIL